MIINSRVRLEGVTKFLTSQYLPKFLRLAGYVATFHWVEPEKQRIFAVCGGHFVTLSTLEIS